MSQVIDIQSGWHHTKKFFDGIPVPSFAKDAEKIRPKDLTGLPASSFADSAYRRFPCHTKAATMVSYLLFNDQEDKFPEKQREAIENSFAKKAAYWGILDQMQKTGLAWRHRNDPAPLTDDDYAMVTDLDGVKSGMPIQNPENIKAAARHLKKYAGFYPMKYRQEAARKILKRAKDKNVSIPNTSFLQVIAHTEPAYPIDIAAHVQKRASLVEKANAAFSVSLRKIAGALQNTSIAPNRDISEVVCGYLEEADAAADLHKLYGQIPLPEEACFSSTLSKTAKALKEATVQLVSGDIYTTKDLVKAGLEVYKAMDPKLASSLTSNGSLDPVKVAEIVPTIPLPQARRLHRNLQAVGIRKMSFSKLNRKSAGHRLSEAAWKAFAAEAGLEPDNTGEKFSLTFRPGKSTLERAEENQTKGLLDL